MNKLRLSKVGSTICHARSSITTPLILFFNLSYLILQFRIQNRCCNRKNGSEKMRKSYPSNITREHSFSRYNNAQNISYRSYVRRRVFFLLFPDLTEWFRIVAHGEGFPMTSRTEKLCVTTTTYSPSRMRTASACLIKSCKNWSRQKEKSIRDADTAKKKGYDAGKPPE